MIRTENPELSRIILNHLSDKYEISQPREGIHLSTLVYCLTRSFFDSKGAVEPTDEEVMLFALGYGLQDVLTPPSTDTPTFEEGGIIYRPDMLLKLPGFNLVEIKTTRMSSKKDELPDTWLEYIKGGCHIKKETSYDLAILYLMGNYAPPFPQLRTYKLEFESKELDDNWNYLMTRRDVFQSHVADNTPPEPYMWRKEWECKNCRHKLNCAAISLLGKKEA